MRPFGTLLSFNEAKEIIDNHITTIERTEKCVLDDAVGRVLAKDFAATMDIPPFSRAAMDGYAVKAADTTGAVKSRPVILKIAGEAHAGDNLSKIIISGQCLQIATGAMMPPGADAVVMVEDTERSGDNVSIFRASEQGSNIGKQGEDIKQGVTILKSGVYLDPGKIGVLASHGLTSIEVYEKPRVGVIPTGEEVVQAGKKLKPGQLYDINSHTISALVKDNGGIPVRVGIAGDSIAQLKKTINEALKNDIVVLSGGSSVGERDLVIDVIQGWGEILFHGVKIKPGKPTMFAIIESKPVLGMPGFPTSCLFNSYMFLLPSVRKMARLPARQGSVIQAKLSKNVTGASDRPQFLTIKLAGDEAVPVFTESGAITSIANADGYIQVPENTRLEKGVVVTVTMF